MLSKKPDVPNHTFLHDDSDEDHAILAVCCQIIDHEYDTFIIHENADPAICILMDPQKYASSDSKKF